MYVRGNDDLQTVQVRKLEWFSEHLYKTTFLLTDVWSLSKEEQSCMIKILLTNQIQLPRCWVVIFFFT